MAPNTRSKTSVDQTDDPQDPKLGPEPTNVVTDDTPVGDEQAGIAEVAMPAAAAAGGETQTINIENRYLVAV